MHHKFGTKSGAETRILRTSTSYYTTRVKGLEKMSDGEENAATRHRCEDEQLEKEIDKEIQTQVITGRNRRAN